MLRPHKLQYEYFKPRQPGKLKPGRLKPGLVYPDVIKWLNRAKARALSRINNRRKFKVPLAEALKRRLFIYRKHTPKLIIAFLITGLSVGVLQSYNLTEAELRQTRSSLTHSLQDEQKAKSNVQHQLEEKNAQNNAKDAQIKDLQGQLQTKKDAEARLAEARTDQAAMGGVSSTAAPGAMAMYYEWGQCVWYVATKLPVPDNWGNANTWDDNARAQGYLVTTQPKVGAIAQSDMGYYGHVAIVSAIDGGQVQLDEMNVYGVGVQDYRWVSVGEYIYIYL